MLEKIILARGELLKVYRGAPHYPAVEALYEAFQQGLEELEKRVKALESLGKAVTDAAPTTVGDQAEVFAKVTEPENSVDVPKE